MLGTTEATDGTSVSDVPFVADATDGTSVTDVPSVADIADGVVSWRARRNWRGERGVSRVSRSKLEFNAAFGPQLGDDTKVGVLN